MPLLSTRRKGHTCNFVYKGLNNKLSKGVNKMFNHIELWDNNNTRAIEDNKLSIPFSKLKVCKGNVKIRGAEYYNSVNTETQLGTSYESFKSRLMRDLY